MCWRGANICRCSQIGPGWHRLKAMRQARCAVRPIVKAWDDRRGDPPWARALSFSHGLSVIASASALADDPAKTDLPAAPAAKADLPAAPAAKTDLPAAPANPSIQIARGDSWTYEIRDNVTGDVRGGYEGAQSSPYQRRSFAILRGGADHIALQEWRGVTWFLLVRQSTVTCH
jgi:hypothetical protein